MEMQTKKACLSLLLLFGLTGCSEVISVKITLTSVMAEQLPLEESTPTVTPVPTRAPFTPTSMILGTNEVETTTPQPTLSALDTKNLIISLLQDNGGCRLPCIWELSPGRSDVNFLFNFLEPFGSISVDHEIYVEKTDTDNSGDIYFILWENDLRLNADFTYSKDEGKVGSLGLYFELTREEGQGVELSIVPVYGDPFFDRILNYYRLSTILSTYGKPSEVWIAPFPDDTRYNPPFVLTLAYKEQKFAIEYILPKEIRSNSYVGCPWKAAYISLNTVSSEQELSAPRVSDLSWGVNALSADYPKMLEKATSMTLDEFYGKFRKPEDQQCVETPLQVWPGP
jgi:hypothetical protein